MTRMMENEKDLKKSQLDDSADEPVEHKEKKADHSPKKEKKKASIEDKLDLLEEELKSIKDKYLRTLAEMENLQRRTSEEIRKERKYASMTIVDKLIDHFEVFDQALAIETDDANFKNFLTGFKMIKEMMFQSLQSEGVEQLVTPIGKEFDPTLEHAFDTRYDETKPEHTILEVVKKGYKFKDRLLRPTLVVINIKPESDKNSNNQNQSDPNVA
jgi:molecular chaperone GrpE